MVVTEMEMHTPPLTVASAIEVWAEIRAELSDHLDNKRCDACTPYITVCIDGQNLSEAERAAWSLVRRARDAEVTP